MNDVFLFVRRVICAAQYLEDEIHHTHTPEEGETALIGLVGRKRTGLRF
jgi:hypothetical protein